MANELVKYTTDHGEVELSPAIIRNQLVPKDSKVTEQEVMAFLNLCKFQNLNPFIREAYLVKYGDSPATIVTGKEVFTKRAKKIPEFAGFQAGITVVQQDGTVTQREGSLSLAGERLVGGWCRVYLKGYTVPYFDEVSLAEYIGKKSDGTPTKMWAEKTATMIRKVALVHALREAFPETLGGMYSQEEINSIDPSNLPTEPIVIQPSNVGYIAPKTAPTPKPTAKQPDPIAPTAPERNPSFVGSVDDVYDDVTSPDNSSPASFVITFGIHKGKTLAEIASTKKGVEYLEWIVREGRDASTRATVESYFESMKPSANPAWGNVKEVFSAEPQVDMKDIPLPWGEE